MKRFAILCLLLMLPALAFSQQKNTACRTTTLRTTGRQPLVMPPNVEDYPSVLFGYDVTGSPSSLSFTIEAGTFDAADVTPETKITAVTGTSGDTDIGSVAGAFEFWYANIATLSGGTNPTIVIRACPSKSTFTIARFATNPTFSGMTLGSVFFAGTGGLLSQDNTGLFYTNSLGHGSQLMVGGHVTNLAGEIGPTLFSTVTRSGTGTALATPFNTNTIVPAGTRTGPAYGYELNLDNNDTDVAITANAADQLIGLPIISGGTKKPLAGLYVHASDAANNAWRLGMDIQNWQDFGLRIGAPLATGNPSLYLIPKLDDSNTLIAGRNAADDANSWSIQNVGNATFPLVNTAVLQSQSGDQADAGFIRMGNTEGLAAEANPAGTDGTFSYNASNQWASNSAIVTPVLIATTSSSPASNAACTAGTVYWDADYIYICTATGVVKRAALTGGY